MLGLETIICPESFYNYTVKKDELRQEFLVWDNDEAKSATGTIGPDIYGFDSYWKVYHSLHERQKEIDLIRGTSLGVHDFFLGFRGYDKAKAAKYRSIFTEIAGQAKSDPGTATVLRLEGKTIQDAAHKLERFIARLKR
jgi:hypothetical protein